MWWFGALTPITLFLVLVFYESRLSWFRLFREQGRSYVSTKTHNNSFIELEFEIAACSLLGLSEKKMGKN